MKKLTSRAALLMIGTLLTTPLFADSDKTLQAQVEALTERLSTLEQRLDSLENKPVQATRTTIIRTDRSLPPPTNPGEWQDTTNWIHLKVGMDYNDIQDLIGEPLKIRRGASEYWFYTDQKFDGPHLKFLFKKLNAWKAPKGDAKAANE